MKTRISVRMNGYFGLGIAKNTYSIATSIPDSLVKANEISGFRKI